MEMKFECCKKELGNYCCVFCHNIFHKSCCDRKKERIIIQKHQIYCSEICAKKANDEEKNINELYLEINKLAKEIEEKNIYIGKIKRRSQDFEDEVLDAEQSFIAEIDGKNLTIVNLKKKIEQLLKEKNETEKNSAEHIEKKKTYEDNIRELNKKNNEMRKQIETLNRKNITISNELEQLRGKIVKIKEIDHNKNETCHNKENEENRINMTKLENSKAEKLKQPTAVNKIHNKILILGDEHGKNINHKMRNKLEFKSYKIQSVLKPKAPLKDVMESIEQLTNGFTKDDIVILIAGTNDLQNYRYPSFRVICDKLKLCSHTNVIISSVPFARNKKLDKYILKYNSQLLQFTNRMNELSVNSVTFTEINTMTYRTINKQFLVNKYIKK